MHALSSLYDENMSPAKKANAVTPCVQVAGTSLIVRLVFARSARQETTLLFTMNGVHNHDALIKYSSVLMILGEF